MQKSKQWIADLNNGTYRNPILYTDYSDPDVIRVGDDYFLVASSFCNAPGLPILHSKDLVNWKVINYAISNVPNEAYERPLHGCGVWAPAIRYHAGVFYIVFPMPDEGIYVTTSTNPWEKWSEPHHLYNGQGWIDPCPFWDDDGRCYMISAYAKSRIGFNNRLRLTELTPDCREIIDMGYDIFDGNEHNMVTLEGPKFYKRGEFYYIFAPSGGVKQGVQTILRSKNIWGPYESRDVLMQKDTPVNGPHQGAWVDTRTGEDWFLHFQDVYAAGRIIHLQPMKWLEDGWPVIGEADENEISGKPVLVHKKPNMGEVYDIVVPEASDEFESETLGIQWQWNANWKAEWYEMHPEKKCISLKAIQKGIDVSISNVPNLLLQKWCMPEFSCNTKINLEEMQSGDVTGLISMAEFYAALAVERREEKNVLKLIYGKQNYEGKDCKAVDQIREITEINASAIYLKMLVKRVESTEINTDGPYDFPIPREVVELFYSVDGILFEKVYSFIPIPGRWVGVKMGLFCCHEGEGKHGEVSVDYFRISDL